ncbi:MULTISPECIES: JAB domain-containing protein [unclassified Rhodanobacter]|uniref:RadC family protein n=1 Tax=Rhodanobacter humi TaxID=1888173 RepID=A0ABV4AVZ4_9GAMM
MDHQYIKNNTNQEPAQASSGAWGEAGAYKGVASQPPPAYVIEVDPEPSSILTETDRATLLAAAAIYERVLTSRGRQLGNPRDSGDFIKARLFGLPYEVFGCLFLDNRHRVLCFTEMFRGTVDGASVHPREVVKEALAVNACAVIFAHNHPSGVSEPSAADRAITRELQEALRLVGVRVLDHLVVGDGEPVSMAARGLI